MLRDDLPVRYDAGGVGPRRTDYPVWRRSTNEGSVAAPPAEPKHEAGPPMLPPPTPAPAQRRFNFLIVGLTILLAAGLVGALTFIRNERAEPPAKDPAKTQVRNAYLSFYSSLRQAYKELDMAPVQALLTPVGAQQQQAIISQAQQSGFRYDVSADHDAQPFVYAGGELASV